MKVYIFCPAKGGPRDGFINPKRAFPAAEKFTEGPYKGHYNVAAHWDRPGKWGWLNLETGRWGWGKPW